ncbi:MAG: tetraacyldisaccharide 4'-kinase [Xanthomonadaceae bacterium]|nr:tetraacyldisaccharide 4'-kinase [Xanthomonadaceae bacterium]
MNAIAARADRWLAQRWYGGVAPGVVLRVLARAFGWWVARRAEAYRAGRMRVERIGAAVIVVGNVVVGGTGKTPLTIALAHWLLAQGRRPGVVTRGYGRRGREPLWARAATDPRLAGDEPVLIAQRTDVPVRVDRDRVRGAHELVAAGCDVVIADDGLQHYRLGRDLEIEVVDAARGYGNGLPLPAGPLREPLARARRCDLRVIAGDAERTDDAAMPPTFRMRLQPLTAMALASGERVALDVFRGHRVHALAGIGNPSRFFATLRALGIEPIEHVFADHHAFRADDLAFADALPVLMTEKDAVKCRGFADARCFAVAVEAQLTPAFYHALSAALLRSEGR